MHQQHIHYVTNLAGRLFECDLAAAAGGAAATTTAMMMMMIMLMTMWQQAPRLVDTCMCGAAIESQHRATVPMGRPYTRTEWGVLLGERATS